MPISFLNKLKEEILNIDNDIYEEIYGDSKSLESKDNTVLISLYKHLLNVNSKNTKLNKTILKNALNQDFESTMKILLYSRDIKFGLGMREVFKECLFYIALNYDKPLNKYINLIIKIGRYDDLYCLFDTKYEKDVIDYFKIQIEEDCLSDKPSNLCKWLKSINTSSKESRRLGRKTADGLGLSYEEYRKLLSTLRGKINLTEQKISLNRWNEIDYEKVPKLAYRKYYNTFKNKDPERFNQYKASRVNITENNILEKKYISRLRNLLNGNYLNNDIEEFENSLKECNEKTSGNWVVATCLKEVDLKNETRYLLEILVLNLYFLFNNVGRFENYFFKTSDIVNFKKIKTNDLLEIIKEVIKNSISKNIDIETIMDLILFAAIKNDIKDEELPSGILFLIHDLEEIKIGDANICSNLEKWHFNLENIKEKWDNCNYTLPEIKICMLNEKNNNFKGLDHLDDIKLLHGFNYKIFNSIINDNISDNEENPLNDNFDKDLVFLEKLLNNERYKI